MDKVCKSHERHFSITTIYKTNPSPPAFPRLHVMTTAKIYIMDWFCGGYGPHLLIAKKKGKNNLLMPLIVQIIIRIELWVWLCM